MKRIASQKKFKREDEGRKAKGRQDEQEKR